MPSKDELSWTHETTLTVIEAVPLRSIYLHSIVFKYNGYNSFYGLPLYLSLKQNISSARNLFSTLDDLFLISASIYHVKQRQGAQSTNLLVEVNKH